MASVQTLKKIQAPSLYDSNFGSSLSEVFNHINDNFATIANADFVKGGTGKGVVPMKIEFFINNKFTKDGSAMIKAVLSAHYNNIPSSLSIEGLSVDDATKTISEQITTLQRVNGISVLDYFKNIDDNNKVEHSIKYLQVVDPDTTTSATGTELNSDSFVGSASIYIFRDARFYSLSSLSQEDIESMEDVQDLTCSVIMTGYDDSNKCGKYEVVTDTPSVYYDKVHHAFCWKIAGQKTGIIAQGPNGVNGNDANIHIFQTKGSNKFIWDNGQFKAFSKNLITSHNINVGDACIVFNLDESKKDEYGKPKTNVYFTNITKVQLDPLEIKYPLTADVQLPSDLSAQAIDNIFAEITTGSTSKLKGLSVPLSPKGSPFRHMIYSMGNAADAGITPDLHISPLNMTKGVPSKGTFGENFNANANLILDYNHIKFNSSNGHLDYNNGELIAVSGANKLELSGTNLTLSNTSGDKFGISKSNGFWILNGSNTPFRIDAGNKMSFNSGVGGGRLIIEGESGAVEGASSSSRLIMDENTIQSISGSNPTTLYIQKQGTTEFGGKVIIKGNVESKGDVTFDDGRGKIGSNMLSLNSGLVQISAHSNNSQLVLGGSSINQIWLGDPSNSNSPNIFTNGTTSIFQTRNLVFRPPLDSNNQVNTNGTTCDFIYGKTTFAGAGEFNGPLTSHGVLTGEQGLKVSTLNGSWTHHTFTDCKNGLDTTTKDSIIEIPYAALINTVGKATIESYTADENGYFNRGTHIYGRGLIWIKIATTKKGDDKNIIIKIKDAPSLSLISIGVLVGNSSTSADYDGKISLRANGDKDVTLWEGKVSIDGNSSKSLECLIWTTSGANQFKILASS